MTQRQRALGTNDSASREPCAQRLKADLGPKCVLFGRKKCAASAVLQRT